MVKLSCGLYCRAVCITRNFSESQNTRFIIKSRIFNGACTVYEISLFTFHISTKKQIATYLGSSLSLFLSLKGRLKISLHARSNNGGLTKVGQNVEIKCLNYQSYYSIRAIGTTKNS